MKSMTLFELPISFRSKSPAGLTLFKRFIAKDDADNGDQEYQPSTNSSDEDDNSEEELVQQDMTPHAREKIRARQIVRPLQLAREIDKNSKFDSKERFDSISYAFVTVQYHL
jgi:hypothetical protein